MERLETTIKQLPRDVLDTIVLKLTPEELINWCKLNPKFARLCSPEEWRKRTERDFGEGSYIQVYKSEIRNYKAAQVRDIMDKLINFKEKLPYIKSYEQYKIAATISEQLAKYLRQTAPEDFEIAKYNSGEETIEFALDKVKLTLDPPFKEGRITVIYESAYWGPRVRGFRFEWIDNGEYIYEFLNAGQQFPPDYKFVISAPVGFKEYILQYGVLAEHINTLYNVSDVRFR
jgi:hypothetical protein